MFLSIKYFPAGILSLIIVRMLIVIRDEHILEYAANL